MGAGSYKFKTKPFVHQVKAMKKLFSNEFGGALLMDVGTGKTKAVIDYLGVRNLKYGGEKWLVVCPKGTIDTWVSQFELHLPDSIKYEIQVAKGSIRDKAEQASAVTLKGDVLTVFIINFDAFSSKDTQQLLVNKCIEACFTGVIIDESHRIKSPSANRTKALIKIGRKVPYRIIMTGTVSPNNPLDVFGQWKFLNPARFGESFFQFKRRYAIMGGYQGKEIVGFQNQDDLQKHLHKDAFVAKKEDCLDLPPVTEEIIPAGLSHREEQAYEQMAKYYLVKLQEGGAATVSISLTKILRLRQITSGFIGYEDDFGDKKVETLGRSKLDLCMDRLDELVDAGEKVVVFAHFIYDVKRIAQEVAKQFKGVRVGTIYGGTKEKDRREILTAFYREEGPQVLVAQMRAVGISINEMVVASNAIFYSLSERIDDIGQAIGRLDRQGQTKPVTIQFLLTPNSMDEVLYTSYKQKCSWEDLLLQDPERWLGKR